MRKKLTALFLCLVISLSVAATLASCTEKSDDSNASSNGDQNKEYLDNVPDINMNGAIINFAIAEADNDGFHYRSIYADEESDDSVDIAVFQRNRKLESRFNCTIEVAHYQDQNLTTTINTTLQAGDPDYDILAARQYDDVALVLQGHVLDLNTLSDYGADYIDLSADYWPSDYIEGLKVGDGTYWVTGDLCMRYTGGFYCYFVNTQLYERSLQATYGSIYDVVKQGNWSLDLLAEMAVYGYEDDGNDKVDTADQLGVAQPIWDNTNGMSISAGVKYSTTNADGTISLLFTGSNETLISFMEKMYTLLNTPGVYNYGGGYQEAMLKFSSGEATFVSGRLNQAELYLRDMMDDYAVIPNPKLSAEQENYVSSVHDAINLYGICAYSAQIDYAAALLEALEAESYHSIRPVYYDSALKFKYTRGGESAEMIDLMNSVSYSDFVYVWQFSAEMSDLGMFLRNTVTSKSVTSAIKRNQKMWQTGLDSIQEKIDEI